MIARSVPEIEGGSPELDGEEEEGLVLEYSSSMIITPLRRILLLVIQSCQVRYITKLDKSMNKIVSHS